MVQWNVILRSYGCKRHRLLFAAEPRLVRSFASRTDQVLLRQSLQQYFNGWLQGVNSYGQYGGNQRLGFYFNLDICDRGPSPSDAGSLSPATFSYLIALFVSCLVLLSGV